MRHTFGYLCIILISIWLPCCAQKKPAPDYLTTQSFPDSVKNVSAVSYNGSDISFGDIIGKYKGKKVVIDIWASWCRDCIVGVPKLNDLINNADEKTVYLMLSIDEDESKWKAAINRFSIQGEHYRIKGGWKNPLANYIVLDWVPRYMVLDEEGRVFKPKAITVDALEQLLSE